MKIPLQQEWQRLFFQLWILGTLLFLVTKSCPTLWYHELQHARLLCPPLSARVCSNSYPLSQWCYLTISSSVAPFFCLQYFPASGSFPMSWLLNIGRPKYWSLKTKTKYWSVSFIISPSIKYSRLISFRMTGLILQSKGLSRIFSSTIPKHQFFDAQHSLWSSSHMHTWLLEKP